VNAFLERALEYQYAATLVGLTRQAEAIGRHDTVDRLPGIQLPTLVTVGADDSLVPPPFSREIHARIPRAEFALIPDAGHLHFMEQFEAFNDISLGFLRTHRRGD
jgi:pimeloyl-ACP methyl ester carboxylesterase